MAQMGSGQKDQLERNGQNVVKIMSHLKGGESGLKTFDLQYGSKSNSLYYQ